MLVSTEVKQAQLSESESWERLDMRIGETRIVDHDLSFGFDLKIHYPCWGDVLVKATQRERHIQNYL